MCLILVRGKKKKHHLKFFMPNICHGQKQKEKMGSLRKSIPVIT